MSSRFHPPLDTIPHDGAFTPVGRSNPFETTANDLMLEAWCQERHESIELGLYLDESLRLMRRILAAGEVTPQARRRAKSLLRAIRDARRNDPDSP